MYPNQNQYVDPRGYERGVEVGCAQPASPKPPLLLRTVLRDLEELSAAAGAAQERAFLLADSMLGALPAMPSAEQENVKPLQMPDAASALRSAVDTLRIRINAIHDQLQRLESLW